MKTPYTKNTKEVRRWLKEHYFYPLSFFQGGEFIYPIITKRASKSGEYEEFHYATFNDSLRLDMPQLDKDESEYHIFTHKTLKLLRHKKQSGRAIIDGIIIILLHAMQILFI